MTRTANIDVIDLLESTDQELSRMIDDPDSPLCVRFVGLVNEFCERYADTSTTVEVMDYSLNPLTGNITLKGKQVRGRKVGGGYAILPNTKQIAAQLEISAMRFGYVAVSPLELLMTIKYSNQSGSYKYLRQLIQTLEDSL